MRRFLLLAVTTLVLASPVLAWAEEEFQNVPFFYPLVTRRPVIERELEFKVRHDKGSDGRRTEVTGAIELPILPRWQVELEIPLVFTSPRGANDAAGIGDIRLENKVAQWNSIDL